MRVALLALLVFLMFPLQAHPEQESSYMWKTLDAYDLHDKQNMIINLELPTEYAESQRATGISVSAHWNAGRFRTAISKLAALEEIVGPGQMSAVINYRDPIVTSSTERWGGDVWVVEVDSAYGLDMDIHYASGNIFVVPLAVNGTATEAVVCYSSDNGNTWTANSALLSSYHMADVDIAIVGDYCYIVTAAGNAYEIKVSRANVLDGELAELPSGGYYTTVMGFAGSDRFIDVDLVSNQDDEDAYGSRLYVFGIATDGLLHYAWSDESAEDWTPMGTGVSNASRGLDACLDPEYDSHLLNFSYITIHDTVRIIGFDRTNGWELRVKHGVNSSVPGITSISGYADTVVCLIEYYSGERMYNRYITYRGNVPWWHDQIDDTSYTSECPAVTRRRGHRTAAVYRDWRTFPRQLRFARIQDSSIHWTGQVEIGDEAPHTYQPCIQPMDNGDYAVAYIRHEVPYMGAVFFDRGACCRIRGDINNDGAGPDISDLVYLVAFMFSGGPEPPCMRQADITGDGFAVPDISDLVHMVNYMFGGGPPPVACP